MDATTDALSRYVTALRYDDRGHARNPMTDADVESKFRDLSTGLLGPAAVDAALQGLWHLEDADRAGAVVVDLLTVAR